MKLSVNHKYTTSGGEVVDIGMRSEHEGVVTFVGTMRINGMTKALVYNEDGSVHDQSVDCDPEDDPFTLVAEYREPLVVYAYISKGSGDRIYKYHSATKPVSYRELQAYDIYRLVEDRKLTEKDI